MPDTSITEALAALDAARQGAASPVEFLAPTASSPAASAASSTTPGWVHRDDVTSIEETPATAVVRTSGSTGAPKQTLLPWSALEASAEMTAEALGGHGQWLLTLHPSYVAGLAVLTRSLVAGTSPVALLEHTTDPSQFAAAAEKLTGDRRYVSLVPTQLQRLLAHTDDPRLLSALRRFNAILLGGGRTDPQLFNKAKNLGLNVIRTYGMSETCGGCIYDGYPLPGVSIELGTHGRVMLSGPMVASGYYEEAARSADAFDVNDFGQRRFRTDDLGELTTESTDQLQTSAQVSGAGHDASVITRLHITGRTDDVIITGGIKVSAEAVRVALESAPSVREAFVTGIEDSEWGQKVAAAVVLTGASRGSNAFAECDDAVRQALGPAAVPKHYELLGHMPLLPNGKPDRQALTQLLSNGSA